MQRVIDNLSHENGNEVAISNENSKGRVTY